MKVLLIGTLVTETTAALCYDKGVKVSAADIAQKYILHGLQAIDEVTVVDMIGAVRIQAWPKGKVFRFTKDEQSSEKGYIKSCPYMNIPFIGFGLRELSLISSAKKWGQKHINDKSVVIFIYAMTSSGMKAARTIKRAIPNAKIVLIVPDLPLVMRTTGKLHKIAKKVDWQQIRWLMKHVDKYMLYTKYMAEYLALEENKWILFEGLIDEKNIVIKEQKKNDIEICLYAGNLASRYGINTLIEAFTKIKSNAVLHIYGSGADAKNIKEQIQTIPNVEFKGQVTQEEIFEIMKEATLLINPRPSSLELTKYSCPSKTFEYMASGTPVLMNKLAGLPDEYSEYITFFKDETSDAYAKTIDEMLSLSESSLLSLGMSAAMFLRREKNSKKIMQKVLQFILE